MFKLVRSTLMLATRLGQVLSRRGRRLDHLDRPKLDPRLKADAAYLRCGHLEYLSAAGAIFGARAHASVRIRPDELGVIDHAAARIRLAPLQAADEIVAGAELDYDVLVLAFGSRANDFATPGVVEHCHFIDGRDRPDAFNARLRAHVVCVYLTIPSFDNNRNWIRAGQREDQIVVATTHHSTTTQIR